MSPASDGATEVISAVGLAPVCLWGGTSSGVYNTTKNKQKDLFGRKRKSRRRCVRGVRPAIPLSGHGDLTAVVAAFTPQLLATTKKAKRETEKRNHKTPREQGALADTEGPSQRSEWNVRRGETDHTRLAFAA